MTGSDALSVAHARHLNAWHALGLVSGYVLAQLLGGFLVGAIWDFNADFQAALRGQQPGFALHPGPLLQAWVVMMGLLLAGGWTWLFSVYYAKAMLRVPAATGIAWRPAPFRAYGVAILTALLLVLLVILVEQLYPPDPSRLSGPLEQLARAQGLPYALFGISVVLIAPLLEEFVFRGVAFAAVARSFGTGAAVILTTLAFVLLHYADKIHYWPGFVFVAVLGLAAAGLRLRYRSLWPGMLLHCGYNGVVLLLH